MSPARKIRNGENGACLWVLAIETDGAVALSFRDVDGQRAMVDVTLEACEELADAIRVAAAEVRAASKKT